MLFSIKNSFLNPHKFNELAQNFRQESLIFLWFSGSKGLFFIPSFVEIFLDFVCNLIEEFSQLHIVCNSFLQKYVDVSNPNF